MGSVRNYTLAGLVAGLALGAGAFAAQPEPSNVVARQTNAGRLAALGSSRELKQAFASRPIVEIHTPRAVEAMRALEDMPEVEKSSLFGTAVHAVLSGSEIDPGAVSAWLGRHGHEVSAIDLVQPSLEDVFLDVVEKAGRA